MKREKGKELTSYLICQCSYLAGFIYFTTANFLLTLVASALCVCFAPTAAGPGIPEIKAYLNGVDTPNMFGATTLMVKVCEFRIESFMSISSMIQEVFNE